MINYLTQEFDNGWKSSRKVRTARTFSSINGSWKSLESKVVNHFLDGGVLNLRSTPSFVKAEHSANPAACICILKSSPALVLTHLSAFSRALKLIGNLQARIFLASMKMSFCKWWGMHFFDRWKWVQLPEVFLETAKNYWDVWAEVLYFWIPFLYTMISGASNE